jgi:hypothetical protein
MCIHLHVRGKVEGRRLRGISTSTGNRSSIRRQRRRGDGARTGERGHGNNPAVAVKKDHSRSIGRTTPRGRMASPAPPSTPHMLSGPHRPHCLCCCRRCRHRHRHRRRDRGIRAAARRGRVRRRTPSPAPATGPGHSMTILDSIPPPSPVSSSVWDESWASPSENFHKGLKTNLMGPMIF